MTKNGSPSENEAWPKGVAKLRSAGSRPLDTQASISWRTHAKRMWQGCKGWGLGRSTLFARL